MVYFLLFYEFFKVGLFSIGGGLATIPFLRQIGRETGWFGEQQLANMIAVSESTPGPMGVNMATYVGFEVAGAPGAVLATLGLIFPSVVVILVIARFLQRFRQSRTVDAVFYGLRPASTALIAAAGIGVAASSLLYCVPQWSAPQIHWGAVLLCVGVFVALRYGPLKKLHPILFIAVSAAVGVVFQF